MTREIMDFDEGKGLAVNTFWRGNREGVQITLSMEYIQFDRDEAIKIFETIIRRLKKQRSEDSKNPPWWQTINKKD